MTTGKTAQVLKRHMDSVIKVGRGWVVGSCFVEEVGWVVFCGGAGERPWLPAQGLVGGPVPQPWAPRASNLCAAASVPGAFAVVAITAASPAPSCNLMQACHAVTSLCLASPALPRPPARQVFATHTKPDFTLPWQRRQQYTSKSTGFAIKSKTGERWLLTNAHSVSYWTQARAGERGASLQCCCSCWRALHLCFPSLPEPISRKAHCRAQAQT